MEHHSFTFTFTSLSLRPMRKMGEKKIKNGKKWANGPHKKNPIFFEKKKNGRTQEKKINRQKMGT